VANPNVLIAGGCSFTQVPGTYKNWPIFLRDKLNIPAFFVGAGSSGNDFISRRVISQTSQALLKYKPEELLVGVMWSGVSRKSFYFSDDPIDHFKFTPYISKESMEDAYANPNTVVMGGVKNTYFVNPHYNDELSKTYYKTYHDTVGALIETIEHILRLQWFLKLNNIKYFFTEYSNDSFTTNHRDLHSHPDVKYLYDQIDFNNFLPVENMEWWIRNESGIPYIDIRDNHPIDEMSSDFCDKIIIPHIKSRGYVS
jgi:hypothetical protein